MDKMVGRVVQKTQELGIAEHTLILFCGDNGTSTSIVSELNNQRIVGGKGKTTDAGTRVALVAHGAGVPAGKVCSDLVDFSDVLPTCLDAAKLAPPTGLDGRSFFPQLQGLPGKPREWMYCYYCPRPERTAAVHFVRDKRWKLYGDGRLYDVAHDVKEKTDLADSPQRDAPSREAKAPSIAANHAHNRTIAVATQAESTAQAVNVRPRANPDGESRRRNGASPPSPKRKPRK